VSDRIRFEELKMFTEEHLRFNKLLGIKVERLARGEARLEVPFREDLLGDPKGAALHGGLVSTLIDTCGATAVFSTLDSKLDQCSTVDLRVDYLRPGQGRTLAAEAKAVRIGKRIALVDIVAFHPGLEEEPIALGRAVFNIRRAHSP
jgi:uncharacterized protein (TIGR00369 family)